MYLAGRNGSCLTFDSPTHSCVVEVFWDFMAPSVVATSLVVMEQIPRLNLFALQTHNPGAAHDAGALAPPAVAPTPPPAHAGHGQPAPAPPVTADVLEMQAAPHPQHATAAPVVAASTLAQQGAVPHTAMSQVRIASVHLLPSRNGFFYHMDAPCHVAGIRGSSYVFQIARISATELWFSEVDKHWAWLPGRRDPAGPGDVIRHAGRSP